MDVKIVIERKRSHAGPGLLHSMEACPDRLSLASGTFDELVVNDSELAMLKARHPICPTCQQLDVASSVDRVRYLLANMANR